MKPEDAKKLMEPFPKTAIGKIDRGHGVVLDYVGHAATTKRLLEVDPMWTWEPMAVDERGLPTFDAMGGLWIKLTVCGHTRLGYGDAGTKKGPNAVKEAVGDAIRNAAMRFGVAIDLWAKEDIETTFAVPKPVASEDQVVDWIDRLAAAKDRADLQMITLEIAAHHVNDASIEALRHAYTEKYGELDG